MSRMNNIFEKLLATFSKYLHHPLKKEKKLSTDTTVTERGGMEGWRGGANTSGSAQHDGRSSGRTESEAGWWWTGPPHRLPAGVGADPVRGVDHVNKIPQCDVMQAEGAMWSSDFSKAVRYFVRALHWLQSIKMFFPGMLLKFFFKNISTGMTSDIFQIYFCLSTSHSRLDLLWDSKNSLTESPLSSAPSFFPRLFHDSELFSLIPVWGCVSDQEYTTGMQPPHSRQGGGGANVCLIVWSAFRLTQVLLINTTIFYITHCYCSVLVPEYGRPSLAKKDDKSK